jgi:3',5'-cyclic AMP phosphodiesterase CpdA
LTDFVITPGVRGPYIQPGEDGEMVVVWSTATEEIGVVELAQDEDFSVELQTYRENELASYHIVRIPGLSPGSVWRYRIVDSEEISAEPHVLRTAKSAGQPIRFACFGDSGSGLVAQSLVGNQVLVSEPDFILLTGDLVYPDGAQIDYDIRYFSPYSQLIDHVAVYPCIGNHDVRTNDGEPYLRNFVLPENGPDGVTPERCYAFTYGDAIFVSIDGTLDSDVLRNVVVPWARDLLLDSDRAWRVVYSHFPLYMSGTPSRSQNPDQIALWGGLFDETEVDLYLAGHNHHYERTYPIRGGEIVSEGEGTIYLVTGAGGQFLYEFAPRPDYIAFRDNQNFGFTMVEVDGLRMTIRQISAGGEQLDNFEFVKAD